MPRLQIRPIVHNYGKAFTTPPSNIRVRAVVWAYGRGQTDTQIHTQTRVTTIHFASSTTHAKCNKWDVCLRQVSSIIKVWSLKPFSSITYHPHISLESSGVWRKDEEGAVRERAAGSTKTPSTNHQQFSTGTGRQRDPRRNQLTQVYLKKISRWMK